jgi:hypothetical protein
VKGLQSQILRPAQDDKSRFGFIWRRRVLFDTVPAHQPEKKKARLAAGPFCVSSYWASVVPESLVRINRLEVA